MGLGMRWLLGQLFACLSTNGVATHDPFTISSVKSQSETPLGTYGPSDIDST